MMSSIRCNHALAHIDLITSLETSRFRKTHLLQRVRAVWRLKFRGWDFCFPIRPTLLEAAAPMPLMEKLQHLGKQAFKKNAIKTEIRIPRTGTPQRHQQTGDLGRLRGRICHAKTGVKSYETSGF